MRCVRAGWILGMCGLCLGAAFGGEAVPEALTPATAEEVVRRRRSDREMEERAKREAALAVPAEAERVVRLGDRELVLRRVPAVPPRERVESPREAGEARGLTLSPDRIAAIRARQKTICLGGVDYGGEHARILWREPESGRRYVVWTNLDMKRLRGITRFEADGIRYDCFLCIESLTRENDWESARAARRRGVPVESRWKTPPRPLAADGADYVVEGVPDEAVPAALRRQLDALFSHYLANREKYDTMYQNWLLLREARRRDLEENPPKPADRLIINYTPLRGDAAR